MKPGHISNLLLLIISLSIISGCASTPPSRELSSSVPRYVMLPNGQTPLARGQDSTVHTELVKVLRDKVVVKGEKLNILQLSGGGQNGSFGAGFLNGWSETGTRPQFDVVTGVSTGAIISTFAFLGTGEDDTALEETWLSINADSIYSKAVVSRFLGGEASLYDSKPLADLLASVLTPEVLERVAQEYDKGRRLYVSTTNLDYDQTWVWDLTAIAKYGGEEGLELYRKAVRASASPPILFDPVEIEGSLFVDGGTKHNVLIVGLSGSKYDLFEGTGIEVKKNMQLGNVYTIMHHKALDYGQAVPASVKEIIPRASGVMLATSNADTLLRSYFISRFQDIDFHVAYVTQDLDISEDVLAFDPDQMKRMFEAGRELAKSSEPWKSRPLPTDELAPWLIDELTRRLDVEQ